MRWVMMLRYIEKVLGMTRTANIYSHSTSLLQLKRCAITANGGVLILAVLHYSYSTPKSRTNDINLDEQLIFIRITAIVSTMQNVHLGYD